MICQRRTTDRSRHDLGEWAAQAHDWCYFDRTPPHPKSFIYNTRTFWFSGVLFRVSGAASGALAIVQAALA